jgi:aldehyde:ferredoxin oxidoreductase
VWLSIVEGQPPALRDAATLWGLDTYQTQQRLRDELGDPKVQVSIGPAGETRSCTRRSNDHGRAAGPHRRRGDECKNLKAIAVGAGDAFRWRTGNVSPRGRRRGQFVSHGIAQVYRQWAPPRSWT